VITNPKVPLYYLAGILNSRLIDFVFRTMFSGNSLQGGYLRIGPPQLKQLPIRIVDASDTVLFEKLSVVEHHVTAMLDLHAELESATGHAATAIRRQIEATDRRIDQLG
jgi:hypothetical protein